MYCPNCKLTIQKEDNYCTHCGVDLSKKPNKKMKKGLVLLAIVSVVIIIFLGMNRKDQVGDKTEKQAPAVVEQEASAPEKRTTLLAQAEKAIDEKAYDGAAIYLDEALVIEQDETTEGLKELTEQMASVHDLYIEDELGAAYDELRALLSKRKEGKEYAMIYQQAQELKEQIKTSHQLKWAVIMGRGGEWDFDEQNSLLDLEFGEENPEYFNYDDHGRLINDFLTYLDNEFVLANYYDEDEFLDGIYIFYDREQETSTEIANLAEEVAEIGIPVIFYTPQRDQSIAMLAGQIGQSGDSKYFADDEKYYAIVKGAQQPDANSPYLTKTSVDAVIDYLKQVLEDGQY